MLQLLVLWWCKSTAGYLKMICTGWCVCEPPRLSTRPLYSQLETPFISSGNREELLTCSGNEEIRRAVLFFFFHMRKITASGGKK
uniref:Secreted protein n=1 Tax=Myripristis murdjan TaxID=586833 RepID=A0A667Y5B5_9TELE